MRTLSSSFSKRLVLNHRAPSLSKAMPRSLRIAGSHQRHPTHTATIRGEIIEGYAELSKIVPDPVHDVGTGVGRQGVDGLFVPGRHGDPFVDDFAGKLPDVITLIEVLGIVDRFAP
jgi:hypothetical protein